jgi:hypothetical protein
VIFQDPIIVRIVEPPSDPTGLKGLADLVVGTLGVTGAAMLVGVVIGGFIGGVLVWKRSRS